MDRPTNIDSRFLYKMRSEREERLRKELEIKVQHETGARMAQDDGYLVGTKDAQEARSFEELRSLAERYQQYLDPTFQPMDRQRLAKEWFITRNGIVAPEPHSEAWRIGYCRGVIDVFKVVGP